MRHILTLWYSGQHPELEITRAEYEQIRDAQADVLRLLQIEELFGLILGNYVDFEHTLLRTGLEYSVYEDTDYRTFHAWRYEIERRILNLLSAARSYLDQVPQRVDDLVGTDSVADKTFCEERHTQFDALLGYRVMEALRNYVQHRGLPVGKLSAPSWVDKNAKEHRIRTTITPYLVISRLEEDEGFRTKMLEELRALEEDELDLKPLIRDYVGGLGKVHVALRTALGSTQEKLVQVLRGAIDRYRETDPERTSSLAIAAVNDDGDADEHFPVFLEAVDQLEWLQLRSRRPEHFRKTSISSEVYGER